MKTKLLRINAALILFLLGLLMALGGHKQAGAVAVLASAAIIVGNFVVHLIQSTRQSKLWTWQTLAYSSALLGLAIIFMHGFSTAIGMMMVFRIQIFTTLYVATGFLLPVLLFFVSRKSAAEADKTWITIGIGIGAFLGVAGLLGFTRIIPFPAQFILYSWVSVLFFYVIFLIKKYVSSKEPDDKQESLKLLLLSIVFLAFWLLRFVIPSPLEEGLTKAIGHLGFVPLLILPLSILSVKKLYPYIAFLLYFICLDVYFVQFDRSFNYLVDVGLNGCEGYDQTTDYPVNMDPGIPIDELLREPSAEELEEIRSEWQEKDVAPQKVSVVHAEAMPNGDSLKVISHLVNGAIHYGAIRIPKELDVATAPILLELEGGGTGLDISKLRPFTEVRCKAQKNQFLSILPAFRGCIIRGTDFCFRSEGYFGDTWLGPAEDAIAFLEAVKFLYQKPDSTPVLASGLSRGATVAMIIGGLTDKLDYIIATSTHSKFLDVHVLTNERVGQSYARAFYTPAASPAEIRKRIIASSPYYFAANLPPFDLHQGGKDELTTIWHAQALQNRLQEIGRDSSTYNIFIYENQGHAYDEERLVCEAFEAFLDEK